MKGAERDQMEESEMGTPKAVTREDLRALYDDLTNEINTIQSYIYLISWACRGPVPADNDTFMCSVKDVSDTVLSRIDALREMCDRIPAYDMKGEGA